MLVNYNKDFTHLTHAIKSVFRNFVNYLKVVKHNIMFIINMYITEVYKISGEYLLYPYWVVQNKSNTLIFIIYYNIIFHCRINSLQIGLRQ